MPESRTLCLLLSRRNEAACSAACPGLVSSPNMTPRTQVKIWDPVLRLNHWCLAGAFTVTYWLGNDWLAMHAHLGYVIILLVLFRILWGFGGPAHALFRDFLPTPVRLACYFRLRAPSVLGHDPLGAIMIFALLASLSAAAISGLTLYAMEGRGPLAHTFVVEWPARQIETLHGIASEVTFWLVIAHVAGVLCMGRYHRQRLIRAMFDGWKWRA